MLKEIWERSSPIFQANIKIAKVEIKKMDTKYFEHISASKC